MSDTLTKWGHIYDHCVKHGMSKVDAAHQASMWYEKQDRLRGILPGILIEHADSMWSEGWYNVSIRLTEAAAYIEYLETQLEKEGSHDD